MDATISKLIPLAVLLVLGIIEAIGGLYLEDNRSKDDFKIELISLVTLPTLIQPAIFFLVLVILSAMVPGLEDYYLNLHFGLMFGAFLILDDLTQY